MFKTIKVRVWRAPAMLAPALSLTAAALLGATVYIWSGDNAIAEAQPAAENTVQTAERKKFVYSPLQSESHYKKLTKAIRLNLSRIHFVKLRVDDQLSEKIFDAFLDNLDAERNILLREHIDDYTEKYRHQIDEILNSGDLDIIFNIFNFFRSRALIRLQQELDGLQKHLNSFDFSINENLLVDRELAEWQTSEAALDDLWRRYIKNQVLSLKINGKDEEQTAKIISERLGNELRELQRMRPIDVFNLFMNSYMVLYDAHTSYMSPTSAENFNINMRLSLEGIGAVLQQNKEYIKVVSISPGGPAKKQGELQPGAQIIGVAQNDQPFEDIIGWRLDEVIDKIRGPRGTVVRLKVLQPDETELNNAIIIAITRGRIELEQQTAKKKLLEIDIDGKQCRIGIITLPSFYLDFGGRSRGEKNYRSATRDVSRLIEELKQEYVDGLIIDLRNNGGGSLDEANAMVGMFIESGPTVQVKRSNGRIYKQGKVLRTSHYSLPLAVLINRLSASASEIFSGAIQDYNRGLVIGGQSYGKGTVQSLHPMPSGQIKVTDAKFYRISGASTQLKGVMPDILFPPVYYNKKYGEENLKYALAWDQITGTRHRQYHDYDLIIDKLRDRHINRTGDIPEFNFLRERVNFWQQQDEKDKWASLSEAVRREEQEQNKQRTKKLEMLRNPQKNTKEKDEDQSDQKIAGQTEDVTGNDKAGAANTDQKISGQTGEVASNDKAGAANTDQKIAGQTGDVTSNDKAGAANTDQKIAGQTGDVTSNDKAGAANIDQKIAGQTGDVTSNDKAGAANTDQKIAGQTGDVTSNDKAGAANIDQKIAGQTGDVTSNDKAGAANTDQKIAGQTEDVAGNDKAGAANTEQTDDETDQDKQKPAADPLLSEAAHILLDSISLLKNALNTEPDKSVQNHPAESVPTVH